MDKNKLLAVYNTCGIREDNIDWYIECIHSLLNQNFEDCKIVLSSCLNSEDCLQKIRNTFGSKILYCIHTQAHTVNITFNKTVQECVKKYGEFEYYLYIDSGCLLDNDLNLFSTVYQSCVNNDYGILSVQTNTDTAFQGLGLGLTNDSEHPQICDEDYVLPIGQAINLHVFLFCNDIYKKYNKIIPDVFAAHYTESTFGFLCSSVQKRWAIIKDLHIQHLKSIDGATLCKPHHSSVYKNRWNNLLYDRNALDFITSPEARKSGLGYGECDDIMHHDPNAYDEDGNALYADDLSNIIQKYLFLTDDELSYDNNIEGYFLEEGLADELRKVLVVYNTCGINGDNTDWYIESLKSLLNQDFKGYKIVLSSCLNSKQCLQKIRDTFGPEIWYCIHTEPHTVNITFNKTVQECVKQFGEFEGYMYIDSGCSFENQTDMLSKIYQSFKQNDGIENGIVYAQVDTDCGLQVLGNALQYQSSNIQIQGSDRLVPVGKGINLHVSLFDNKIYKEYGKIIPDVFAAFCTESTFSFVTASVGLQWIIMADRLVRHLHSMDGAVASNAHYINAPDKNGQIIPNNSWNNLLYNRSALEFIHDPEAIECGLGYEECQNIMIHNSDAYIDGLPLYPEQLKNCIRKYFFLTEKELDYNNIQSFLYAKLTCVEDN